MDLQLNGKVILVTGGAKGIGAAIVRECAKEGAIPAIVDKDVEAGKAVQAELRQAGMACEFVAAELGAPKACAFGGGNGREHAGASGRAGEQCGRE